MAAALTDLLTQATTSSRPTPTQVTSTRSAAGATLACNALTGWPTATAVHFCTYKINTSGAKIAGSQIDMKGIVSGTNITNITIKAGTDVGNAVGDIVEAAPTAAWANDVVSWGTAQHSQLGAHVAVTNTGGMTTDTLTATTSITDGSGTLLAMRSEQTFDFVVPGGAVLTGTGLGTTLGWNLTAGVVYIGGKRLTVAAATGTVTASKDTYFDLLDPGTGTVATLVNTGGSIVANNAASPALAASSVRLGIIVSGATIAAAGSVNQGEETKVLPIVSSIPYQVTDSLGNLICPRDPNRRILGYRQSTLAASTASAAAVQVGGLTVPVIIPSGRKIRVTIFTWDASNSTAGAASIISAWDGTVGSGTLVTQGAAISSGVSQGYEITASTVLTPTATSKTYNFGLRQAGGGTTTLDVTTANYLLVELV